MRHASRSSSRDRELACPASIVLSKLVAPAKRDDGDEGTMLHWLIASRAIAELGATPPEGGLPPPAVPAGYVLPKESEWIVGWCLRHIKERIPANWSLMVEVELEHAYDRWDDKGHIDLLGISPDATQAIGVDWKTGRDPVDAADENWQVLDYTALTKLSWPSLTRVEFDIAQPRLSEADGDRITTTVLEGERLEAAPRTIDENECRSLDNLDEINSGRKQCRWCQVGIQCPAKREEQKLMKMKLTKEALAAIKREPDDATLADWVITARSLAQATKDAEALLHERLDETGVIIAGNGTAVTRKVKRGSYEVQRPVEFLAAFRAIIPGEESLAKCFNPSMTRIKDEIAEKMSVPKTGMASVTAESVFDAHLRPHVKQGESRVLVFN